jgi:hypothetical protein
MNSNLIHLHDIIQEKKLAYFILTDTQQQPTSFWISDEKDKYDGKNKTFVYLRFHSFAL